MELDDLKKTWNEQNAALEKSLQLTALLVARDNTSKANSAIGRFRLAATLELIALFVIVIALGSFAANHLRDLPVAVSAALIGIYAIGMAQGLIRQMVCANDLDFDEPVVRIAHQLEQLRILRLRMARWALAIAPLMWLPILAVLVATLAGSDIYATLSRTYLAANAIVGIAILVASIVIARRYAHVFRKAPGIQRMLRALIGSDLRAAIEHLDVIHRFECAD